MTDDKKIRDFFESHKSDVPNNGFSTEIMNYLLSKPPKKNILPQIIIVLFAFLGIGLAIGLYGMTLFVGQINDLITSIATLQVPSPSFIFAYLLLIKSISMAGVAIYDAKTM